MIDLNDLMRLREAATPGPWDTEYRERENGMYGQDVFTSENGETIATIAWYPKPLGNGVTSTYRADNAAYIVAACNAVPELVQRIRELEAQCDWLAQTAANSGWGGVRVGKDGIRELARRAVQREEDER